MFKRLSYARLRRIMMIRQVRFVYNSTGVRIYYKLIKHHAKHIVLSTRIIEMMNIAYVNHTRKEHVLISLSVEINIVRSSYPLHTGNVQIKQHSFVSRLKAEYRPVRICARNNNFTTFFIHTVKKI